MICKARHLNETWNISQSILTHLSWIHRRKRSRVKDRKRFFFFFFFPLCRAVCGILVPSPNHWTAREFLMWLLTCECFPGGLVVKKLPANAEVGDMGSIPGSGRSPGEGNGNPLQYSCLKNPMDRRNRGATVQRVSKSQTLLK